MADSSVECTEGDLWSDFCAEGLWTENSGWWARERFMDGWMDGKIRGGGR
jgi:hypothetical protein